MILGKYLSEKTTAKFVHLQSITSQVKMKKMFSAKSKNYIITMFCFQRLIFTCFDIIYSSSVKVLVYLKTWNSLYSDPLCFVHFKPGQVSDILCREISHIPIQCTIHPACVKSKYFQCRFILYHIVNIQFSYCKQTENIKDIVDPFIININSYIKKNKITS